MEERKKSYTFIDKRGRDNPAQGEKTTAEPKGRPEGSQAQAGQPIDFPVLVMSFASAAMISMGLAPDPQTGQMVKNLEVARQNINILELLQEKTRGNLNPQEETMLAEVLYELRLGFVEVSKGARG